MTKSINPAALPHLFQRMRVFPMILVALLAVMSFVQAQVYEKVYSFTDARSEVLRAKGSYPLGRLIQGSDGNYYGTTVLGGVTDTGTVFKITPAGVMTTLVEFAIYASGTNKGGFPTGDLVQGRDGNFYGTTSVGGEFGGGTVFRVTPAGVLSTLVNFNINKNKDNGAAPIGGLVEGKDGNFYGTTSQGGVIDGSRFSLGYGTIFKITPAGVLTTLVYFTGQEGGYLGGEPYATLVQGRNGIFYGTTKRGGTFGNGTIFKMTPAGELVTLVNFNINNEKDNGASPLASLIQGKDGNFYGSTAKGGSFRKGTVFKMTPTGNLTTLVNFTGDKSSHQGIEPSAALVQGIDGNFYSTTSKGGMNNNGTAYRMTPEGMLTTLVSFTGKGLFDNENPSPRLTQGSDGNFYGVTFGDLSTAAVAFRMTPSGDLTTLARFSSGASSIIGSSPLAGLIQLSDGDFLGTTVGSGIITDEGTVFKISPAGQLKTLVNFTGSEYKGDSPAADLVKGKNGNFYGTTSSGGANDNGTVFMMTPAGKLTTLVEFNADVSDINRGQFPSGLLLANDGNFYGTTEGGGIASRGTVFMMTPAGKLTTLVDFANDGIYPQSSLIQGNNGKIYGTTSAGGVSSHGTIFVIDPSGGLTTLVNFTGNGSKNKGSSPSACLFQGKDGNFYGSTRQGGASNKGTIFKLKPDGQLITLVNFTGNGLSNKGDSPSAGLLQARDGNFYGTTKYGGSSNKGTVFKMTPDGQLSTLVSFTTDGYPRGKLIQDADGILYGTTSGYSDELDRGDSDSLENGAIYRIIFPDSPLLFSLDPEVQSTTSAVIQTRVNARGIKTSVSMEYGTDGVNFPSKVSLLINLTDYQTEFAGTTLNGLEPGMTYYYRFRARNGAGRTVSKVQSFTTLASPLVTTTPASSILTTSAKLNGTVNARNYPTTVTIEYAADVNFQSPILVPSVPVNILGNMAEAVSASVAGLTKGKTYYYRISAVNAGGTKVSGTRSFSTLTEPIATIGSASALSTTRAQVNGTVKSKGSSANVSFEYGTDGVTFPNSISAEPALVSGGRPVAVTATLTGLLQGTTYYYRIRATGPGGTGLSSSNTFSLSILSGLEQRFPDLPPTSVGSVTVNFGPPAEGGWRFVGETAWRRSGVAATHLESAPRLIEFLPLAGRISPPSEAIDVASGENIVLDRIYFETGTAGSGSLTIRLKPDQLAAPDVPKAIRAQWRIVGESQWRDSGGDPASGLAAGSYLVECKPVTGRVTPPVASVSIAGANSQELTLTYFTANNTGAAAPLPLPFASVSSNEDLPFAYLGQIRTAVGSGTGFVVKRRVVATAGHVVFDDGTLTYISGIQWLFQRHTGDYESKPQVPRGSYLAAGYADQRLLDASPGEGTAESQTLDYAALYFIEEAGRGGYGGFLATDFGDDNEFLTSSANKILAGYPVDAVPAADEGRLHATAPFAAPLTPAFGETWTSLAVRGYGGMSGGPLFVQRSNGSYLPAAIYLGGNGQTVVRAIDSSVVDLFLRAEISGNGGDNNTAGGITHTSITTFGSAADPGAIKVTILPAAAASAGRWGLKGESINRLSGTTASGRLAGDYILELATINGFQIPASQPVRINGGQLTEYTFSYNTVPTISNVTSKTTVRNTATPAIPVKVADVETAAASLTLSGTSGNTTLVPNANIAIGGSGANRTVTVTPAANRTGTTTITLRVSDSTATTIDTFVLFVTAPVAAPVAKAILPQLMIGSPSDTQESSESQAMQNTLTTVELVDGLKYQALIITKSPADLYLKRAVEVSSNLLDWYSGARHTAIMQDDDTLLKVRDNTPLTPGIKRYIRLKETGN